MATINNSAVLDAIKKKCFIQTGRDGLPMQLSNVVAPVVIADPEKEILHIDATKSTTGATAVLAINSSKDFYLNSCMLTITKSAACDAVKTLVRGTNAYSNKVQEILTLGHQTLTAESQQIVISFPQPIRLKKGTNIELINAFTAGAQTSYCNISGYYLEED